MIQSTDDQRDDYNRQEAARIARLVSGTMVRVYVAGGAGMTRMRIVAIQQVSLQNARTKRYCDYKLYQMENAEGHTYYATADFLEIVQ
jgi:hypothetical protein